MGYLSNKNFNPEIKVNSNVETLIDLISQQLSLFTIKFVVDSQNNMIDKNIIELTKIEEWKTLLNYEMQIWNVTKNRFVKDFNELQDDLKQTGTLKLKFTTWNKGDSFISFIFDIKIIDQKLAAEIKALIDSYDYGDGVLRFLCLQDQFSLFYYNVELEIFKEALLEVFTNFFVKMLLPSFVNEFHFETIKNNDHELTQDDLKTTETLNLTFSYKITFNKDNEELISTTQKPLKIALIGGKNEKNN